MILDAGDHHEGKHTVGGAMPLRVCGQVVGDPVPMWRQYARDYPRTIREYDLGDRGDPGVLTEAEAWRSRIIGSRLTHGERDEVIGRAVSAPWASVPADADLGDADPAVPGGLFASAACLYWTFTWPDRISGVAVAKVHKILHLKRPGLYPILDDRVKGLYEPCAAAWPARLQYLEGVTATDSPPYWAAIRADLITNHEPLEACRGRLAEDENATVRLMARLTRLRLQDIIAWMIASGRAG